MREVALVVVMAVLSMGCAGRGLEGVSASAPETTETAEAIMAGACQGCHGTAAAPGSAAFDLAQASSSRASLRRVLIGADSTHPPLAITTAQWDVLMRWTDSSE